MPTELAYQLERNDSDVQDDEKLSPSSPSICEKRPTLSPSSTSGSASTDVAGPATSTKPVPHQERPRLLGARFWMLLFFSGAVAMVVAHHFFYTWLNGRSASGSFNWTPKVLLSASISEQSLVNLVGNVIVTAGSMSLSAAIGVAFAQAFWRRLKVRGMRMKKIDTVLDFKDTPTNPFTWIAFIYAPELAIVVICASAITLVSIVAPGSLTVVAAEVDQPCNITTVDLSAASLSTEQFDPTTGIWTYLNAKGQTTSFVTRVMMSGTYFEPPSQCGLCQYNISFVAPAVQCANITQAVNVTELLDPAPSPFTYVWNAEWQSQSSYLLIASRDLVTTSVTAVPPPTQQPVIALNCTGYNATYHVTVKHNESTTLTVQEIDVGPQLTTELLTTTNPIDHQLYALWDSFSNQMNGSVQWDQGTNEFTPDSSWISWSPLGDGSSVGVAWGWSGNLQDLVPAVMQNISLSLLTGQLSHQGSPTTSNQDNVCAVSGLKYTYNRLRLLVAYGAGLVVTAMCMAFAFAALRIKGRGDSLGFSRILEAHPHTEPGIFDGNTKLKATDDGRLEVTAESNKESQKLLHRPSAKKGSERQNSNHSEQEKRPIYPSIHRPSVYEDTYDETTICRRVPNRRTAIWEAPPPPATTSVVEESPM